MTTLQRSDALEGLEVLKAADLPRYKRAIQAGKQLGFEYYFPHLLARQRGNRSVLMWVEDEGTFCLFILRDVKGVLRLELPVAPTPMSPYVLRRCLERCNAHNGDHSARVLRIDERDAPSVASLLELRVEKRRLQYLYSPAAFADLSGRRYRTLRRNVALVESRPDVEVLPWSRDHDAGCRDLLKRWGEQHRALHGTSGGAGGARRVLDLASHFPEPDLRGEVIRIDGVLAAFAFGGEMYPGVGCFLEARCDPNIRGLSYFQRSHFLAGLTGMEWVNDGSDVGRAGLRQLKDSLRPVGMHAEYRGFQEAGIP
jgi:hypothetical protein